MTDFFTADLHFKHSNIIKLCNRPFKTVQEHDEFIIECINKVVKENDNLYILGDLGFFKIYEEIKEYMLKLNGNKTIIYGNHDNFQFLLQLKREGIIKEVRESKMVQINGQQIFLSHFPHREWKGYYRGAWHLFGHCHNNLEDFDYSTDVGVDSKSYTPWSFNTIKKYFENTDIKSKYRDLDNIINQYYPDMTANYFINLCINTKEIKDIITNIFNKERI